MDEKDVSMTEKCQTFNSFVFGTPMITLDKLTGSENYKSLADSVDLWFIGNRCEDHLTTYSTSLLPPSSCLWLCLFCSYSHSWARQTLYQSHKVCWVILSFRGVIVVILPIQIATLSLLMSPSLKNPPSSPLQCVLLFQMSYLFLLFYPLPISLLHL